jgi:hypothetical protein
MNNPLETLSGWCASSRQAKRSSDKPVASVAKIPVAVSVKPVLAMIRAHLDGENHVFKQNAVEVARELSMMGEMELSEYILAQYHLVRTFEVTD